MHGFDVLVDETEKVPVSDRAGYEPDGTGKIFMAGKNALLDVYSVPSAFAVYRKIAEDSMA